MKKVKAEEAVGKILAHEIVEYGLGTKKVVFRRGYRVKPTDIEKLKDLGSYSVYINWGEEEKVHENEAAQRIAKAAIGDYLTCLNPSKGRVRIHSTTPGLFKAKVAVIEQVNLREGFVFAYLPNKTGVRKGEEIASVKLIPISIGNNQLQEVEQILRTDKPVINIIPPKITKIGLIITGTEVYEGRIKDAFRSTLEKKLARYDLQIQEVTILPDDEAQITAAILQLRQQDYELVFVTGGTAVDALDVTPQAIKATGAKVISRGVPIFPGNMLMIAQLKGMTILGVPACVLPDAVTSFDILLPRILAKEPLSKKKLVELAEGGLL
ncbi:MAG: molybdopterin-binding protein [Candidatus Ranarchaeia archaeon]